MFFNFWRISAYFRRSCFCFRRLSIFKPGTKIQSDFCPRFLSLFLFLAKTSLIFFSI
ncbi:hypothetical protein DSH65_12035 [Enterococcus faecalis]|uniref:Uncharacterized protein n=1 Tax=Enterococcus faecalis TaxID=1351 RepID=A0A8B3RQH1_ENTFL|nr:hypothetical protein [Enterococcus faecalis]EGO8449097.1 hypothetical protein [Enterococcus faecalis]EGO8468870.1 hypothetical protein [Enterococcus faecalis]EGO8541106.1 hypothetical protein [Enterococcus faecalis]EGO8543040.1 hypothetical protein [Enterococcus faecalis]